MRLPHGLMERWRRACSQLPNLRRVPGLVWAAARWWSVVWVALLLVQGLLPALGVFLSRSLVNGIVALREQPTWQDAGPLVLLPGAALLATLLTMEVANLLATWVRAIQAELLADHIAGLIHAQSVRVDLAFYEMPEFYDHLHRARLDASYRPLELVENAGLLLQHGLTLIALSAVLVSYSLWLPVALLIATVPALAVVLRTHLERHAWQRNITARERQGWYYDWVLTSAETAAEVRLFGLGPVFQRAYQEVRRSIRQEQLRLLFRQGLRTLLSSLVGMGIAAGVLAWMFVRTIRAEGTLGDLVLLWQSCQQGHRLLQALLERIGQLYSGTLYLQNLFDFLALDCQLSDPARSVPGPAGVAEAIVFRQISFRYPGSAYPALEQFDLHLKAGSIVAVVGPNGAGKSTLLKLLCRFYDPEVGSIEWDGVDLRRFGLAELRRQITVLFQKPVHYSGTVRENLLATTETGYSAEQVRRALRDAGALEILKRLPRGEETLLGRHFTGGTELSQGEWQRIALARAFLRPAPLLLLDEPTSALDSWAEADWFERLREEARGRTVLLITHRFTTAMHADCIHVMEYGRIVEAGTHQQLLQKGGLYAQSWEKQGHA